MMKRKTWRAYVLGLCMMWGLSEEITMEVLAQIQALVTSEDHTEEAIQAVLVSAGLGVFDAELAAPTIRAAIRA
jgi:hypothetical protein